MDKSVLYLNPVVNIIFHNFFVLVAANVRKKYGNLKTIALFFSENHIRCIKCAFNYAPNAPDKTFANLGAYQTNHIVDFKELVRGGVSLHQCSRAI